MRIYVDAHRSCFTVFDAYRMDGTRLWRIDLGRNVRSGAHYTQFLVYDFDGDGRAEIAIRTSDGTIDGTGKVLGDAQAEWVSKRPGATLGKVLAGPEYVTIFDGQTGAALGSKKDDFPRILQKTICNQIVFWYSGIALVLKQSREKYGNRRTRHPQSR